MININMKNPPKVKLASILRRRRTTLKQFVLDTGAPTYDVLVSLCSRMGVQPPSFEDYDKECGHERVTNQQEGIVVIEPVEGETSNRTKRFKRKKDA